MRKKASCQARRNRDESGLLGGETVDFVHSGILLDSRGPQLQRWRP